MITGFALERLAEELTARFYDSGVSASTREEWEKIHKPKDRGLPENIPSWEVHSEQLENKQLGILDAIRKAGLVSSNSEARRIILSDGLYLVGDHKEEVWNDPRATLTKGGYIFRLGKRRFIRILIS